MGTTVFACTINGSKRGGILLLKTESILCILERGHPESVFAKSGVTNVDTGVSACEYQTLASPPSGVGGLSCLRGSHKQSACRDPSIWRHEHEHD